MISIIVIVKNDRKIEKLLEKLQVIDRLTDTEIIVVDASNGGLDDIKKKFNFVNWIYFKNIKNKKTTIPDQRNLGIKSSEGDIIVFTDSDCIPESNWLNELTRYIQNNSEQIVAGRVILEDINSPHEIEALKKMDKKYIDECPTMNMALSRNVFNKIGYFDESFQYGSDVDLCWRAIKAGLKIRFNKEAIIFHDLGDKKNELRRMYVYGKARVRLYKKHKYRWKFFIHESQHMLYPLFFIFLPITIFINIYPLLILIPILKNLNKNPLNTIIMKTMYGLGFMKELINSG